MKKWELKKSDYLIKEKWLKVRANTYVNHNDEIVSPYYIFDYPDWVNIVAITVDNHLVVNRQYRPGLDQICLELPSGWVDKGESSLQAARRELLEETGCHAQEFIHTGSVSVNPATHNNLNHCYLALGAERIVCQNLDFEEDIENELIPLDKVRELVAEGKFIQSLHVASILYASTYLSRNKSMCLI